MLFETNHIIYLFYILGQIPIQILTLMAYVNMYWRQLYSQSKEKKLSLVTRQASGLGRFSTL
jgi:hypothetical protein